MEFGGGVLGLVRVSGFLGRPILPGFTATRQMKLVGGRRLSPVLTSRHIVQSSPAGPFRELFPEIAVNC